MVLGVSLLNHTLVGPLSVVGNALHIILSRTLCRCIRVLNVSKWSSGSFNLSYASPCGIWNLVGRGKEVTYGVKGESICWTSSSRLGDTHPFMAFIIMSIFSFIISMSCAMCIALLSNSNGQSISSCRSCLLGMLLSSWSFLSLWSPIGR